METRPATARAVAPAAPPAVVARRRTRRMWPRVLVLAVVTVAVLFPFWWMLSHAFTPEGQPVSLIPAEPTTENFQTAVTAANLDTAFANSTLVTVVAVLTNCIVPVIAGYAFAHLPFRGSSVVFYVLLSTVAIPGSVTLIPLFLMAKHFPLAGGNDILGSGGSGLLDSVGGLMLPYLVGTMNIFLSRQYFASMDRDFAEAARIDGAGELRIFAGIYLPMAKPLLALVAVFSFTGVWDDFLWPLVVSTSERSTTVQLAITTFASSGNVKYGALMAATILVTIPVLAVFLLNQRGFISGLADGGIKG
ncbi:binding-protein-dependent transport systems inner membrane component [Beutenbergia cavernae DSM 12333]|uniref:Binding-protein-dependent transport systems inner membrane component n=1 Tax=Beutenbergia cavernae (strain ATCC BAA-8 / DSM 12333 / CCUG 43141 / JCM 11478 / NBRC 16432 / NCIMB 13614 / HKI 0122) TaxID=471853 RepID=C5C1T9_BEUC1|nr:carbohydrate ABC transporter permease [Beutenbergia cavernae]ACQ79557.1 binding-protein-dependent transport systems inner membrane component [Beutenbergia cavernae DSM 12333]